MDQQPLTEEYLDDLADCRRQLGQRADLVPAVERLVAEVRRYRKLIKEAEFANAEYGICPWCAAGDWVGAGQPAMPHDDACPAFTRDGVVR